MVAVAIVTGELVEQKLHGADVQVELVHMMLTEVTDLQVPGENSQQQDFSLVSGCYKMVNNKCPIVGTLTVPYKSYTISSLFPIGSRLCIICSEV